MKDYLTLADVLGMHQALINQPAMEIYAVMMRLFDEQRFEVVEMEQWLRGVIKKI